MLINSPYGRECELGKTGPQIRCMPPNHLCKSTTLPCNPLGGLSLPHQRGSERDVLFVLIFSTVTGLFLSTEPGCRMMQTWPCNSLPSLYLRVAAVAEGLGHEAGKAQFESPLCSKLTRWPKQTSLSFAGSAGLPPS